MPWSGGGAFTRTNGFNTGAGTWASDKAGGIKIVAGRHDTHDQDLADGINAALAKNGENAATGNLNLGGFRFTGAGSAVADTDLATLAQVKAVLGAPAGTKLLFPATAAVPSGWSIDTTGAYDDAAIRVRTTGSVATGGATGFTTAFATGRSSNAYVLLTADIPSHQHTGAAHTHDLTDHTHSLGGAQSAGPTTAGPGGNTVAIQSGSGVTAGLAGGPGSVATGSTAPGNGGATGGGGGHSHGLPAFDVKYLDSVVGVKS